jgi:hypothetical protein
VSDNIGPGITGSKLSSQLVTIVLLDLTIKLNKEWVEPLVRLKKQLDKPKKLLDKSSIMTSKLVIVVLVQSVYPR